MFFIARLSQWFAEWYNIEMATKVWDLLWSGIFYIFKPFTVNPGMYNCEDVIWNNRLAKNKLDGK